MAGVREMLDFKQPAEQDMLAACQELVAHDLLAAPGSVFYYGGPSIQVAGCLACLATGKTWHALFTEQAAGPLGLKNSYYSRPSGIPPAGRAANPNLQAGLTSTLGDYLKLMSMYYNHGLFEGQRVLAEKTCAVMMTNQVPANAEKKMMNFTTIEPHYSYGLTCWCEAVAEDNTCPVVNSSGAFGTMPWIDRTRGVYGVFMTRSRLPIVIKSIRQMRGLINEILDQGKDK